MASLRSAADAGLPIAVVTGLRFALESGRGRNAVPVRSAILGAVLAIAVLVTTVTFGASLNNLISHPALYGWNWNYTSGRNYLSLPSPYFIEAAQECMSGMLMKSILVATMLLASGSARLSWAQAPAEGEIDAVEVIHTTAVVEKLDIEKRKATLRMENGESKNIKVDKEFEIWTR